jgi:4-hydroxy-tetrahydrodipicolinate reductase
MSTSELRVAILGVSGRMGGALLKAIDESSGTKLIGATASPGSRWIGKDASVPHSGVLRDVTISSQLSEALRGANVAIDFTLPNATATNLDAAVAAGCAVVLGTTGHDDAQRQHILEASRQIPIVWAANTSLGVNLLLKLVELAAATLGDDYDLEIFEAHHRNKKDAPSGTALALGRAAAQGRKVSLADVSEFDRHGHSEVRRKGAIGFSVFRGGDVVGDHTVTFAGIGERIELTHKASDRMAFARGAMQAAQWLVAKPAGLYSMADVLGLNARA